MKRSASRSPVLLLLSAFAATALLAAACGGDDTDADDAGSAEVISSIDDVQSATVYILAEGEIRDFEGSSSFAGTGSGFFIDEDGYIVTNNHVVTGAGAVRVAVGGGDDELPAKVVGVSECTDLAVLQLTEEVEHPVLTWSDDDVQPPLDVWAAGFPLGDPQFTMTKGIVSKAEASGDTSWASVRQVIEHDAAIQPGNSGGPLVGEDAQVVGVNYAGGDPGTGTSQFFAINNAQAREIIERLKGGEDDESIGVNGQAILDEEAGFAGVYVRGVAPGGIASVAGVKPGDLITTLNGVALQSGTLKEYCDVLRSNDLDSAMSIRVIRTDTQEVLEGELNGRELSPVSSFASEVGEELPDRAEGEAAPSVEFVEITDDTSSLVVSVPANWTDTDTAPQDLLGDGTTTPAILAAPSLAEFEADTGPGLGMFLVQGVSGVTAEDLLQGAVSEIDCTETDRADYSDAVFTGRYAELDCGSVLGLVLVATPSSDPSTVVFVAATAASQADLRAIDEILATFNIL